MLLLLQHYNCLRTSAIAGEELQHENTTNTKKKSVPVLYPPPTQRTPLTVCGDRLRPRESDR